MTLKIKKIKCYWQLFSWCHEYLAWIDWITKKLKTMKECNAIPRSHISIHPSQSARFNRKKLICFHLDISFVDANTLLLLQSTTSYFSTCDQLHTTGAGVYHRNGQTWFHLRGMHLQNVIINEINIFKLLYFKKHVWKVTGCT